MMLPLFLALMLELVRVLLSLLVPMLLLQVLVGLLLPQKDSSINRTRICSSRHSSRRPIYLRPRSPR